jgi:hypothetical protein
MADDRFGEDVLHELRETAAAAQELARDPDAFSEAFEAFAASDATRFQAALESVRLGDRCRLICTLFCQKRCGAICRLFCPERPEPVDVEEIRSFALALAGLTSDGAALKKLLAIIEAEDAKGWKAELERLELTRFCDQLCRVLCRLRCRRRCHELCPPAPLITNLGSIPTPSQIDAHGFGHGQGIPPVNVPVDNPAAGVGDHPFAGSPTVKGIFNMPSATEYKLEVSDDPQGVFTPIAVPVIGVNYLSTPPWDTIVTRFPSGGGDPGWYSVSEIADSDGGPNATGEKRLLDWPTTAHADGVYYLRLAVRDGGGNEHVSAPQIVQTDNTAPSLPVITLELLTASGERQPLKCGNVKRGDGLILITVQAFDPNFSSLSVNAEGNSSLSVPILAQPYPALTPAVPLAKTYNGDIADQGYPLATSFLWDPWSDPRIVPCCYIVRIDITDRALSSNVWAGGHGNAGWEAIGISF